jgi:hypothetical protein
VNGIEQTMSRLGQYLRERGILTSEQLLEAERSKAAHGGRLGTNLVKLGLLELEELAAHLSDLWSVPLPPVDWLEEPSTRASQVLPMPLIRRYKLLPLKLEKTKIHVAMLDPTDSVQLDFVATAAGREAVPYVLPEIRLLYWLEVHLGIDRHPRYVNLTARSRQPGLLEEETARRAEPPKTSPPAAAEALRSEAEASSLQVQIGDEFVTVEARKAVPSHEAPPGEEEDEGDELMLVDELLTEEPSAPTPTAASAERSAPAPPGSSAEVATLEAELDGAGDRDEIVRLTLRIARAYSRAAALFVVQGGVVSSFRGDGECLEEQLPGIEIPVLTESIFARPAATLLPFRGEPPDDGIDGRLLRVLGRGDVQEVVVHPISIRGRVVNLLYADNGPDHFGETSVAALAALGSCVSRAYERVILAKKAGGD